MGLINYLKRNISISKNSAQQLLKIAIAHEERGETADAIACYHRVIKADESWAVPHYNLGLLYKYQCNWHLSYEHNKIAVELDEDDKAAIWNLGIAATALHDWETARTSWSKFGVKVEINDEEPDLVLGAVPIRLNPDTDGEVVWCKRIDPARTVIENIPLGKSGHRFGDMLLNDGAAVGYRKLEDGTDVPVFNELQLLTKSAYKTFSVSAYINTVDDINKLGELCRNSGVEMEDWSTVRMLCKQCSEGTAHTDHDHDLQVDEDSGRYIGLAATNHQTVQQALADWRAITLCEHSAIVLELE